VKASDHLFEALRHIELGRAALMKRKDADRFRWTIRELRHYRRWIRYCAWDVAQHDGLTTRLADGSWILKRDAEEVPK